MYKRQNLKRLSPGPECDFCCELGSLSDIHVTERTGLSALMDRYYTNVHKICYIIHGANTTATTAIVATSSAATYVTFKRYSLAPRRAAKFEGM